MTPPISFCDVFTSASDDSGHFAEPDTHGNTHPGSHFASVESFFSGPSTQPAASHVVGNQAAVSRLPDLGRQDAWGGTATRMISSMPKRRHAGDQPGTDPRL